MNPLVAVILVILALLTTAAVWTRSSVKRAIVVAFILVLSFVFLHIQNGALMNKQHYLAKQAAGGNCKGVWLSAQTDAEERLHMDEMILFGALGAMAIVATAPRRRPEPDGKESSSARHA